MFSTVLHTSVFFRLKLLINWAKPYSPFCLLPFSLAKRKKKVRTARGLSVSLFLWVAWRLSLEAQSQCVWGFTGPQARMIHGFVLSARSPHSSLPLIPVLIQGLVFRCSGVKQSSFSNYAGAQYRFSFVFEETFFLFFFFFYIHSAFETVCVCDLQLSLCMSRVGMIFRFD